MECENKLKRQKSSESDDISIPKKMKEEPEDVSDPVIANACRLHFEYELPDKVVKEYQSLYEEEIEERWPELGTLYRTDHHSKGVPVAVPLERKMKLENFHLKENLKKVCETTNFFDSPGKMSHLQSEFFSVISSYYDFIFSNLTNENRKDLMKAYCLHAMNHILSKKAKIIHHNSKLAANPDEEYRDQGFTRPVCLILVPFREDCLQIVRTLESLLEDVNVMNKKRFENEYYSEKPRMRKKPKPEDYEATFAGNTDEDFRIGLKIKNKSISLFSEFYSSELIIASPLGLRQVIGADGDKNRDFDFLSSIEILIIDRADVILMQNWHHLVHVLNHVNLLPKEAHDCNFFRVHSYALEGLAKYFRQTILLSSVEHGWFKAVFNHGQCFNHAGYVRTWKEVETPSICQVAIPLPQVFRRFDTNLPKDELDDRFNFFTSQVLPHFKDPAMAQTMIFVPSYFDFVRLRNYFREHELSCVMICEYSKSGKVAQARDLFFHGHRHFMLYTERAHFYNRYQIKGIQHIVFYQLPSYPHFYNELCNLMLHSNPKKHSLLADNSCTVLVNKYDCIQLKHIVGMTKAKHILNSSKKVFMIKTNEK